MSTFGNLRGILNALFSIGKANPVEIENSGGDMLLKTGGSERGRFNASGLTVTGDADLSAGSVYKINGTQIDGGDVGLGNVTNDAQLKRAAGDIASFTEKATPVDTDLVLIEDSADSNNKKKVQVGNLPNGGGVTTPGTTTDNALVRWDGTGGAAIQNSGTVVDDNDVITLKSDGGAVKLSTPASDLNANGIIITAQVDANATGVGALLVLSSDGNWDEAQANAAATVGQLGIAMESGTGSGKKILLYGRVRKDAWGWTTGSKLYVSGATAGAMTHTAPSTDAYQIQACGFALSADEIMFAPSPDIGEYVA
jgi:hypothetical protein